MLALTAFLSTSCAIAAPVPGGRAPSAAVAKTVKLNDGTTMPAINLGTCCGSDPNIGLKAWLTEARPVMGDAPVGIDTAWDYHDETDIGSILKATSTKRSSIYVTTKIPTGFGDS
eukprot:COSAG01_NODE_38930_length_483_cov_1.346354_1_plen_114_part_01